MSARNNEGNEVISVSSNATYSENSTVENLLTVRKKGRKDGWKQASKQASKSVCVSLCLCICMSICLGLFVLVSP